MHKLKSGWWLDPLNWFKPLGSQTTADSAATDIDTQDWDLFTIPIYMTSASSTATEVVLSTVLDMLYLEESTLCTDCEGTPITYGGTSTAVAFTDVVLKYPNLGFEGEISDNDVDVSLTSDWSGPNVSGMTIGLISAYSGTDYDDTDATWDGDAYADGWLGMAPNSAVADYNLMNRLDSQSLMDEQKFYLSVDFGGDSEVFFGQESSAAAWYTSESTDKWSAYVDGFMVTGEPSTAVLSNSWALDDKLAIFDTSSMITWIPHTYFDFVMEQILDLSIGFYYDSDLETYVLSCDQYGVMDSLYIKLKDAGSFTGDNLWL